MSERTRVPGGPGAETEPMRSGAAAMLYTRAGRYLMQHRDDAAGARFPGWWCCFGGGVEEGETPAAALRRELGEEIGYAPRSVRPFTELTVWQPFPEPYLERILFFAVPIGEREIAGLRQSEGAGMALRRPEELAADPKVVPWDLAAILMHARRAALFGGPGTPR